MTAPWFPDVFSKLTMTWNWCPGWAVDIKDNTVAAANTSVTKSDCSLPASVTHGNHGNVATGHSLACVMEEIPQTPQPGQPHTVRHSRDTE